MNRAKFDVDIHINQVSNFPFRTGTLQVRWHVKDSAAADSRGRTSEVPINDHVAAFNYERRFVHRIGIRNDILRDSFIVFEVHWQSGSGRINIGNAEINLAEYVHNTKGEAFSYLLQSSRVNCVLNVRLHFCSFLKC